MLPRRALLLALLLAAILPAHARAADPAPRRIVCTVAMVADIVREVAGQHAHVETLIGPGVDPHLFKATRDDVARLLNADAVFYNGLNLEGKLADTLVRVARAGKPVYAVAEGVPESFLLSPDDFEGHFDPHVWMDPQGWIHATGAVAAALKELDPANAADYDANAADYIARLRALDEYAQRALASIPAERRLLITSHDAFNYFGRRYGVEVLGIQGISTVSEAGLADIERLVSDLVERRVPAVFPETTVSDRNIRALIVGAAAQGHTVAVGGALFSDAMGAPDTYEGTYIGMIDHNVTTITRALGGQAPPRGLHGKLAHADR